MKFNFERYFNQIRLQKYYNNSVINKLNNIANIVKKLGNKKILIFGNGGSSAIASHFALDLSNCTNIRCLNFADASMITCFANDYGYQNWVKKTLEIYADNGDVLFLISSSGKSKNMLNACKTKKIKFSKIITFSGFKKNNPLYQSGNINLHVNSTNYNIIENIHQIWLLTLVESLKIYE